MRPGRKQERLVAERIGQAKVADHDRHHEPPLHGQEMRERRELAARRVELARPVTDPGVDCLLVCIPSVRGCVLRRLTPGRLTQGADQTAPLVIVQYGDGTPLVLPEARVGIVRGRPRLKALVAGREVIAGYVVPAKGSVLDLAAANWNTSLGAACFLACALFTLRTGRTSKSPRLRRLRAVARTLEGDARGVLDH